MKTLGLLVTTLIASATVTASAFGAQATTITYRGMADGLHLTLRIETALPAAITKTVSDPVYDPEYQREIPGTTSFDAKVGTAILSVDEKSSASTLYAVGDDKGHGLEFVFQAIFRAEDLGGLTLDGFLFESGVAPAVLDHNETTIEDVRFPIQFDSRWYGAGNGTVHFVRD